MTVEEIDEAWLALRQYWAIEPARSSIGRHLTYDILRWIISPFCRIILPWKIRGTNNIPRGKGSIIAANHLSHVDPVIIIITSRKKLHYMAKDGHFSNFFLRRFMNLTGQIETQRESGGDDALRSAASVVNAGRNLGIFPEGTRSKKTEPPFLLKGKTGVARLAAAYPDTPVVPCAHVGTRDVMIPKLHKLPRPWKSVQISYGDNMIWREWLRQNVTATELIELKNQDEPTIKSRLGGLYRAFTDELMERIEKLGAP